MQLAGAHQAHPCGRKGTRRSTNDGRRLSFLPKGRLNAIVEHSEGEAAGLPGPVSLAEVEYLHSMSSLDIPTQISL